MTKCFLDKSKKIRMNTSSRLDNTLPGNLHSFRCMHLYAFFAYLLQHENLLNILKCSYSNCMGMSRFVFMYVRM